MCRWAKSVPYGPGLESTEMKAIYSRIALWALVLVLTAFNGRSASVNYALKLNGTGQFVELPPKILSDLKEATFEAWILWEGPNGRVTDYGSSMRDIAVGAGPDGVSVNMASPDDID